MSRDSQRSVRGCRAKVCPLEYFDCQWLLQFCALGLGFFQDGDVGVGVFPEREEVLNEVSWKCRLLDAFNQIEVGERAAVLVNV